MIIKILMAPFWIFINFILNLIPDTNSVSIPSWYANFKYLLDIALTVFPADVWIIVIGNIVFWMGVHMVWAVIEWIYHKIPGIS